MQRAGGLPKLCNGDALVRSHFAGGYQETQPGDRIAGRVPARSGARRYSHAHTPGERGQDPGDQEPENRPAREGEKKTETVGSPARGWRWCTEGRRWRGDGEPQGYGRGTRWQAPKNKTNPDGEPVQG